MLNAPWLREIRAIIFDMDGLLLDSERVALAVVAESAAEMGLPWRPEVGLAMVGLNSRDSDAIVRQHMGEDFPITALRAAFGARYEAAIDAGRIPAKPGVGELLDVLDARALPRAVATSTRRSRAIMKLEQVGIAHRMHHLVGGDEVSRGKPNPEIFLTAAQRLRVEPRHCLVLEDSNAGARGGLAAGMRVVVVPDLLTPADDVLAAGATVVESLHRVATALHNLENHAP